MIPNGVYPTMITPFTKDNKIDYAAVEALINWYAGKKVDGIFAICQSSEIFSSRLKSDSSSCILSCSIRRKYLNRRVRSCRR